MTDATIVRRADGRFAAGTTSPAPITDANARQMQAKSAQSRRNKAMKAARNRTVARLAASDPTIQTPEDAWGEMVADQAEALRARAADGKPAADDLIRVGQAMGTMPLAGEMQQAQPVPDAGTDEVIMLIMRRRLQAGDVVDAEFSDAE